jgi:hypothetical protein
MSQGPHYINPLRRRLPAIRPGRVVVHNLAEMQPQRRREAETAAEKKEKTVSTTKSRRARSGARAAGPLEVSGGLKDEIKSKASDKSIGQGFVI